MAAVSKLAAVLVGTSASLAAVLTQPAVRAFILKWSSYDAPGGGWRILAILFALANWKCLPFVWHLRFFRALTYQLYLQPTPIPQTALFQPVITSTRTPILEMDYNLHKSNSTYFSDMDISRTHFFTALIRNGIKKNSRLYGKKKGPIATDAMGAGQGTRGKHIIALGGIGCLFKKEVLPYQRFEMWTRLLAWDKKWFYLVTHLVKPGVAKPQGWSLQPWKKPKATEVDREKLKGAVFATAIAKYVIKRGRITVPPEQALFDAEMLPVKPEGWVYQGGLSDTANGDADGVLPEKAAREPGEWNWNVIEKERLRGLEIAQNFANLDALHEEFDGGEKGVMGEYADLLWA